MPVTPRGRGRPLNLNLPEVKPGEEEDSRYTEATTEPPIYLSPKKLISSSFKTTERRLSISEEDQTLDSDSLVFQSQQESLDFQSESPKSTITSSENANDSAEFSEETAEESAKESANESAEFSEETAEESTKESANESAEFSNESSEISSESSKIQNDANETDPLMLFKVALLEKPFIICSAQFLVNPKTTEVLVIEWVECVMRMSLTSTDFCVIFASYFKTLTQHAVFGKVIKRVTIDYLQEYYEERTTSFEHKPNDFNGSVMLLGQIFLRYQIKGKPLRVFAQPLLECLLMMCDSLNEDNIKIVAEQISLNGKALESIVPETMTQLIVSVQRHLLNTTSDSLRTWLLLIVNLCFYGQPLTSQICEVFSTTIGINAIKEMAPPSADKLQGKISDEFVEEYGSVFPE